MGNHPGNTGGKPGRSGRKPDQFKHWCHELTHDKIAQEVYRARNRSGDLEVMKFAASYDQGKPTDKTELSGEVVIRVAFDGD